jgi:hypothetical protein
MAVVFQKIQDGGWNEKIRFSRHLGFLEKLFFPKKLRLTKTS